MVLAQSNFAQPPLRWWVFPLNRPNPVASEPTIVVFQYCVTYLVRFQCSTNTWRLLRAGYYGRSRRIRDSGLFLYSWGLRAKIRICSVSSVSLIGLPG